MVNKCIFSQHLISSHLLFIFSFLLVAAVSFPPVDPPPVQSLPLLASFWFAAASSLALLVFACRTSCLARVCGSTRTETEEETICLDLTPPSFIHSSIHSSFSPGLIWFVCGSCLAGRTDFLFFFFLNFVFFVCVCVLLFFFLISKLCGGNTWKWFGARAPISAIISSGFEWVRSESGSLFSCCGRFQRFFFFFGLVFFLEADRGTILLVFCCKCQDKLVWIWRHPWRASVVSVLFVC